MNRRFPYLLLLLLLLTALAAPAARADDFGLSEFDVSFTNQDGTVATQAGSHPFAMTTELEFASTPTGLGGLTLNEPPRDVVIGQAPGLVGDATAMPRCSNAEFLELVKPPGAAFEQPNCADSTAVGIAYAEVASNKVLESYWAAVYNLEPPPGTPTRLGFWVAGNAPVPVEVGIDEDDPYGLVASARSISQILEVSKIKVVIWGVPGDPAHDTLRGHCLVGVDEAGDPESLGKCGTSREAPFLTLPRACAGPLETAWEAVSWPNPAAPIFGSALTHDAAGEPQGMTGCGKLPFNPTIAAKPTTEAANSPTGLDFSIDVADEGLKSPTGLAASDIEEAIVTLPEGFSANPSVAEGLAVCGEADVARERSFSAPGAGCPNASKIGTVEVESPLVEQTVDGSLYIAKPYDNPFGSLLAMYLVLKDPELGLSVVQPLEVRPDPRTGQLVTVAENMPQLPFSHFRLHFREGSRSPLVSPPGCGSYAAEAKMIPRSGGEPVVTNSAFEIVVGPNQGPCPSGGVPPFRPQLVAGTVNNSAGSFSPFSVRLTRSDSEQEFTNFSIKLPPGVAAKLAGIPFCSDAQIARAASRTGAHGGAEELADPSCPAASQVGRTLAGAGVGPSLAYAPGKIYLAGPYKGAPVSMVSITSGVVGPFDIGTVVVRLAIEVNPETGEVFLDSTGSDPIPHIINGIPLHVRDIRAYTDRSGFTFNPTSCAATSTSATVLGSGLDFASAADDNPFVSTSRFQAADCAALPFKPNLRFKLKGTTRRGGNPSLRAHVGMSGFGEGAIRSASVTLPKSEFLEQAHIGTVCTRVQFNEGEVPGEKCPAASVYGRMEARTPILDGPLVGPIFLRSNGGERDLPDLVAALHHGLIDINLVGFVDSGKSGGIRNTFAFVPDAPVTSADLTFFGGKKSLLSNSRNLCRSVNKVRVELQAHSGKRLKYKTPLKPTGCKKGKRAKGKAKHR